MDPLAIGFIVFFALLFLTMALVFVNALRRAKRGRQVAEARGWQRHPDGLGAVAGWGGWPFGCELERYQGKATAVDVMTGHHNGARFMSLRYSQHESGRGSSRSEIERYNMVALATEHAYPHLSVVRGQHRLRRDELPSGLAEFEVGDRRFDKRWQTVGDADFGRALLTPEVRAVMDELDHAWVFQPGWVVRVTPFEFYAGEDRMLEELDRLAAPFRQVPNEVWARFGGPPDFLGSFGHTTS